ncbi:putative LAGLIDADG homing endonuclease (mitochondrion) [Malassezia sympodialis ATCC 42132]|uniref:Cox1-i1 ORF n=2 Tax=Malassezia sympodialis TaxID=76777 RepID=M1X8D7_MALS4|nr:cox1-i1 ORF [Malassezia sympodialis ATCC 42132]SHO80167.1 putative LAGLIDADG homing endonuclease [Malassezia sympodialis ATCC 42132]
MYVKMNTFLMKENVKMSSTWGQSAWKNIFPSETTRSAFYSIFTKNSSYNSFHKWLVGIVDGDGCFYFSRTQKGNWTFCFKVSQSKYNLRLLYFIKKMLIVGSVDISENSCAEYRICNMIHISEIVLPIFDKYPLLTSKQYSYEKFRNSLLIYLDKNLSKEQKDEMIFSIKVSMIPNDYQSYVWKGFPCENLDISKVYSIMSKEWLIGFTEAEGSFYLTKKGPNRIIHCFEITQKKDEIVLIAISLILEIKVLKKKDYFCCITTNRKSVDLVIDYFFGTMKGIKSLEYRIWSRSYRKLTSFEDLVKVQNMMRNIRKNTKMKV